MKNCHLLLTGLWVIYTGINTIQAQSGEEIFKAKCSSCHTIGGGRLVGPDLKNITETKDKLWLTSFIQSSQAMIEKGDPKAVAIFKEYNKIPMPDQPLTDQEIDSVMGYITEQSTPGNAGKELQTVINQSTFEYNKTDVENGMALFKGKKRLQNKGVSCITCHTIRNDRLIAGGTLAKNLTMTYQNMGAPGIIAILKTPPFPAMVKSYGNHTLSNEETEAITAFLVESSKQSYYQHSRDYTTPFVIMGILLWTLLLALLAIIFYNRKRGNVNDDIYERQMKIQ